MIMILSFLAVVWFDAYFIMNYELSEWWAFPLLVTGSIAFWIAVVALLMWIEEKFFLEWWEK